MPPPYPNARIPFGVLLDATAAQLLADGVVDNASQIVFGLPDQVPQLSAPFDILLVANNGIHDKRDGGGAQLMMSRTVDIYLRSEAIADPGASWRDWVNETFVRGDKIIASVGTDEWQPQDDLGNLLTVLPVELVGDSAPKNPTGGGVYGNFACTLRFLYMPTVNPSRGVYPIP